MDQRTVLMVSDDAEFARLVSSRWQAERSVPAFTVSGSDLRHGLDASAFDLVIVGSLRRELLRPALRSLDPANPPVMVVAEDSSMVSAVRREFPGMLAVNRSEGWSETVVLLGIEILRRVDALRRAELAEQAGARLRCHATLGQYVIEMRHTLNNALTSVLGNAELLLLEPGTFSAGVRSQIDTIRNMALRMHEILQRFSSLEKELTFAHAQAAKEQRAQAAAVGQ